MDITITPKQQTFTAGELKFIRSKKVDGTIDDLREILVPQMGESVETLRKMISKKPYDLYISRTRNMRDFYSVDANVDFANVIGADEAKRGRPSLVYAGRLERFVSAADEAMKSFEKLPDYAKLTKPDK